MITDVPFGAATAFIPLDAGTYDLKITTPGGGTTLIDPLPVTFNEGGQIVLGLRRGRCCKPATGCLRLACRLFPACCWNGLTSLSRRSAP